MRRLNWWKTACTVLVLCAATGITLPAQTFTTLYTFCSQRGCTDGANPGAGLVQATDGNLYSTAFGGGTNGYGTVFKITPSGTLTTLHSFCAPHDCHDGHFPSAGLVQAANGNFYGTTDYGTFRTDTLGTVFEITPGGSLKTLYSFVCSASGCADGAYPYGRLVQAASGNFYGTTFGSEPYSYGTIFKITSSGTLTTLYRFCSQSACTDGAEPIAGVIQATDGNLYGTTLSGGANGYGTVFKITSSGTLTTLYSFCSESNCADGEGPTAALVQATDGTFYGTTQFGGANGLGTVFNITLNGTLTTLYSFCSQSNCADGENPYAALVLATDGNFYGTTSGGGANDACTDGCGTIFKMTPSGTLRTLYSFCSQSGCADGSEPVGALVQDTSGNFYGTTDAGGISSGCVVQGGCGTAFSLSVGLGPFVETQPTSGKVGAVVKILGTNLTGATSVTFNGTAATFTVVSSSLITTTVPAGATTGTVQVVTPGGTLSSNVPFRVVQ